MNIRIRLFLGISLILITGASLSYFLPKYLVDKDIDKAGQKIKDIIKDREDKIEYVLNLFIGKKIKKIEELFLNQSDKKKNGELFPEELRNLARGFDADVILVFGEDYALGYDKEGSPFQPQKEFLEKMDLDRGEVDWKGEVAYYKKFDIDPEKNLKLYILTQKSYSVIPILNSMRAQIQDKISLNLLWTAFLGLGVMLFLLAKFSKKMTDPIVKIAKAAEEVGSGHYDHIELPDLGKRDDEVATLVKSFNHMRLGLQEREKMRGVLNKVVSKEIATEILKKPIELGGEERVVTILFSDIRGFTKMTEKMAPQKVISLMNNYLTEMCRIIDKHGGVVDKFVGDEIMALYGAPVAIQNPEAQAIKSALEMREQAKKMGLPVGIGIHRGIVVAGNQGSESRLNYTILGANVNLASRLCSEAKEGEILVTNDVLHSQSNDVFSYEELGPRAFKGFENPIPIYRIKEESL